MTSMSSMPEEPADQVLSAVLTASRVLVAVSARSLAHIEERVTLTQFRTLVVLSAGQGRTNLNGLAERLAVTASTAMRTVDRLLAAGLVTRQENPENRREVLLGLTGEGTRIVHDVTATRREEIAAILQRMSSRKRAELVSAFRAFAEAADEPEVVSASASLGW